MRSDTIELTDDAGDSLRISLRALDGDLLVVYGLYCVSWVPRVFWFGSEALLWSAELVIKAAILEHKCLYETRVGWKKLSTRNAVRLAFAIDQLICDGQRYFDQRRQTLTTTCLLPSQLPCPHVEIRVEPPTQKELLLEEFHGFFLTSDG